MGSKNCALSEREIIGKKIDRYITEGEIQAYKLS